MTSAPIFVDRTDAGRQLASRVVGYASTAPIVLGLPRGGVVTAAAVADRLQAPLAVWVSRKLGVPHQPELAFGAIAPGDVAVFDEDTVRATRLTEQQIQAVIAKERDELSRRLQTYRRIPVPASRSDTGVARSKPPIPQETDPDLDVLLPPVAGRTVLVVDDGLATGLTAEAALRSLAAYHPTTIVLAVPVAAASSVRRLSPLVDDFVTVLTTNDLSSVGEWYQSFPPVSDADVIRLLHTHAATAKR